MDLKMLLGLICLLSGALTFRPEESAQEMNAEAGDVVLLSCQCLRTEVITALKWRRTNMEDFVLFYREKRCYEQYQNLLYQNRVQMADPQMANKNLSIILFNTTVNDTGTYLCDVGIGTRSLTLKVIHLKVTPPTAPTETEVEKKLYPACLVGAFPRSLQPLAQSAPSNTSGVNGGGKMEVILAVLLIGGLLVGAGV